MLKSQHRTLPSLAMSALNALASAEELLHRVADVHDSHQLDHKGKSVDDEQEKDNLRSRKLLLECPACPPRSLGCLPSDAQLLIVLEHQFWRVQDQQEQLPFPRNRADKSRNKYDSMTNETAGSVVVVLIPLTTVYCSSCDMLCQESECECPYGLPEPMSRCRQPGAQTCLPQSRCARGAHALALAVSSQLRSLPSRPASRFDHEPLIWLFLAFCCSGKKKTFTFLRNLYPRSAWEQERIIEMLSPPPHHFSKNSHTSIVLVIDGIHIGIMKTACHHYSYCCSHSCYCCSEPPFSPLNEKLGPRPPRSAWRQSGTRAWAGEQARFEGLRVLGFRGFQQTLNPRLGRGFAAQGLRFRLGVWGPPSPTCQPRTSRPSCTFTPVRSRSRLWVWLECVYFFGQVTGHLATSLPQNN